MRHPALIAIAVQAWIGLRDEYGGTILLAVPSLALRERTDFPTLDSVTDLSGKRSTLLECRATLEEDSSYRTKHTSKQIDIHSADTTSALQYDAFYSVETVARRYSVYEEPPLHRPK